VHFVGYLCIIILINARKMGHIKTKRSPFIFKVPVQILSSVSGEVFMFKIVRRADVIKKPVPFCAHKL
jgi:hypothetical protein